MTDAPLLTDQAAFDRALDALLEGDARLGALVTVAGRPALRRRPPGFAGLCAVVVAQQLSVAAARTISQRLNAELGGAPTPDGLLAAAPSALRRAGLSAPKIRTLTGIARRIASGEVDLELAQRLPADEAASYLTSLPGIGLWSADLYLLFCLGRADAFPHGDLALQVAAGEAFGLPGRASAEGLKAIAEDWRPARGVAAHLLWAYYGARRARIGTPA